MILAKVSYVWYTETEHLFLEVIPFKDRTGYNEMVLKLNEQQSNGIISNVNIEEINQKACKFKTIIPFMTIENVVNMIKYIKEND